MTQIMIETTGQRLWKLNMNIRWIWNF